MALIAIKWSAHLDYDDNVAWLKRTALVLLGFVLVIGLAKPGYVASGVDDHVKITEDELRQIAQAYATCLTVTNPPHLLTVQPGDTVHAVALILAQHMDLNKGSLYFAPADLKAPPTPPKLAQPSINGLLEMTPEFARATLSFEMAANVPPDAPPKTTPVVWTRGLRADGTWAPDSPESGAGGGIAFLDGHILWVEGKLSTGRTGTFLMKYDTHEPTANIGEALPPGATVLSAEPKAVEK